MADTPVPPPAKGTAPPPVKKPAAGAPSAASKPAATKPGAAAKPAAGKKPMPTPVAAAKGSKAAPTGKSAPKTSANQEAFNEADQLHKHMRLLNILTIEAVAVGSIAMLLVFMMPMFQTRYYFHSMTPDHEVANMTPLSMPNLTDNAIKAWAANSVTEILTFGFGDYNSKIITQRARFTPEGWNDFVHTFIQQKVGDTFMKNQLVLTTIPEDDPTIVSQEPSETHVYEWRVAVPIIMTYATNNQVTKPAKSKITLTIVRVPYEENSQGIAIDAWRQ